MATPGPEALAESQGNERTETVEVIVSQAPLNQQRKISTNTKVVKRFLTPSFRKPCLPYPSEKQSGKVSTFILFRRILI
jgi:hypothetical protein